MPITVNDLILKLKSMADEHNLGESFVNLRLVRNNDNPRYNPVCSEIRIDNGSKIGLHVWRFTGQDTFGAKIGED